MMFQLKAMKEKEWIMKLYPAKVYKAPILATIY